MRFLENKTNRIIAGGIIGNLFLRIEGHALGYEDIWMKKHGYLTRDARVRERRKVGTGGKARRKKQSPKR